MPPKIATLGSTKKSNSHEDSDDEDSGPKGANAYVGSGQNVIGRAGPSSSSSSSAAGGGGGKGGLVDNIMGQQGVAGASQGAVVIKFYKNGFTVDEGDLRAMEDPANKEFLDSITKGVVPKELMVKHAEAAKAGSHLDISIEDHRQEDYEAPAYRAFSGSGTAAGKSAAPASAVVTAAGAGRAAAAVDASAPTTTIQVKLLNGKREKVTLNLSHTVGDLQAKVASLNGSSGKPFALVAGFPPKPLTDAKQTIEEAGLKNASVIQQAA